MAEPTAYNGYNERDLLQRVAEGDEASFTKLFLHWHQLLAGYVFRITESKQLTEEIVQDVFMKIWMVRETMSGINNFKHFLLVVSRNQAFDVLKKQLKEQERKRTWVKESRPALYAEPNEPENAVSSIIEQAIDSLPPHRKEVYLLSRHERLTYQEIANRLSISKESVKTHLKLASGSITGFIRSHIANIILIAATLFKKS